MISLSIVLFFLATAAVAYDNVCTVVPLGGGRDDGPSINDAFAECATNSKIVLGSYYSVNTLLENDGLSNVDIELSGTVQYTPNIAYWSPNSLYLTYQNASTFWWLSGDNIHIYGGGTIDGNGQVWYDYFAETGDSGTAGASTATLERPILLTIGNASNVLIEDITEIASPNWFVYQSSNVTYRNVLINSTSYNSSAPAKNTDGWDIYRSSYVTITDSVINNDDDCVSLKPNSTNIIVSNLWCNGSHGISVGSLGQYAGETDIVADVYAKNVTMRYAENGARIKVFGGSPYANSTSGGGTGHVKNITFEDFYSENVDNPIIIDQCYFTSAQQCEEYPSDLSISDVHYINVTGSSSGAEGTVVVDIDCSQECKDIIATGTNLTSPNGTATYICINVATVDELDFNCTTT
ncbi:glycoside hydrolase family 28 protein [Laetiporus sulphureus 93-53]|uniref:galacturonan 1,4-alpha-galacturonidase n=1 Tax=Laetiporus sulphureus 93-53 TaxID=1314785 RepID=A0A165CYF8_9APHY|nr:glycoside hydrolase family 28 protein [Laetiporus sulphureus 93-53]KZT03747.1 glycoside hydrolase family 28 protein [Laetiporus sulphureus 93-53]